MKFIDFQCDYRQHESDIKAAIERVLDHGRYVNGPEIEQLESQLSALTGSTFCIANDSGTASLQAALMALGVGPGDEVITTGFSYFATAEVVMLIGAKPVFVDICPKTYHINPSKIEAAITERSKAIIAVSLYGQPADFDAINAIARKHNLAVIDDAAQSLGATYHGRSTGVLADISCTSFFPTKPLGAFGDGGACMTDDPELACAIRQIINHGESSRYHHVRLGFNGRMDSIQAAILLHKLGYFEQQMLRRQSLADCYRQHLPDSMSLPTVMSGRTSVYAQYTIRVKQRDRVVKALADQGIPSMVHYPQGMHQQPVCAQLPPVSLPEVELAAQEVLSLPFYPDMPLEDVVRVSEVLAGCLQRGYCTEL